MPFRKTRLRTLCALCVFIGQTFLSQTSFAASSHATIEQNAAWQKTVKEAQGQTVYFNGWGGSENVNDYLHWAGQELRKRYNIQLRHVKVDDIASVVSRIITEKSAGRNSQGSVDVMWINGENFRAMNDNNLLHGPFATDLPNWRYIDPEAKPTTVRDFGLDTKGMEAPWGMAQLVFMYDTSVVSNHPTSMAELLAYSQKNPGLFTYPSPPDFVGTTFLKQALTELIDNPERLQHPVDQAEFDKVTAPLWEFLDALHPTLWREGRTFPASSTAMVPLLDDGELGFALTFNPGQASASINNGHLPDTIRTYVHSSGTIGNSHFLAIPYNSSATAAAKVAINFLMSPEAQLRKGDPEIWGDPTVLSIDRMETTDRHAFLNQKTGIATLNAKELGRALPEPHPSWMNALEQFWQQRYR